MGMVRLAKQYGTRDIRDIYRDMSPGITGTNWGRHIPLQSRVYVPLVPGARPC